MTATTIEELVAALEAALSDVAALADTTGGCTEEQFAETAAALARVRSADALALEVASAHGYAVAAPGGQGRRRDVRPAGRPLDAAHLTATGLAGLLRAVPDVDVTVLARQLAEHLAGPSIPILSYAALDLDIALPAPVPVADGWELATPTVAELRDALPISTAARYQRRGWDPDFCAGVAMLRRIDPDQKPVRGSLISFDTQPAYRLWEPLLAMSLYANHVIHLHARYVVEPGRHVEPLFERYATTGVTTDGEDWDEIPATGEFTVDTADLARFRRFLSAVAPLIEASQGPGTNRKSAARLRRATEHFLTASENAYGQGEVLSERNAETVLRYVIALEALFSGPGEDTQDLTRKAAQRSAVLVGRDDDDRMRIYDFVRTAYGARSKFAHGDDASEIEIPLLRDILRRCILARLVLGDPPTSGHRSLASLADEALLSDSTRQHQVTDPLATFAAGWDTAQPSTP